MSLRDGKGNIIIVIGSNPGYGASPLPPGDNFSYRPPNPNADHKRVKVGNTGQWRGLVARMGMVGVMVGVIGLGYVSEGRGQTAVSPGGNRGVTMGSVGSYAGRGFVSVSSGTSGGGGVGVSSFGVTDLGNFAAYRNATSTNPWVYPTTATVDVGRLVVCAHAVDDDGDGVDSNDFTTSTDTVGNVFTMGAENTVDNGAGAAGAALGIFFGTMSFQSVAGSSNSVSFGSAKIAKASSCRQFSIAPTPTSISLVAGSQQDEDVVAGGVGQLQVSGLATGPTYLTVRGVAAEHNSAVIQTPTSGWTVFQSTGHNSGAATSSMHLSVEYQASTNTVFTSSPTMTVVGYDNCSTMFTIKLE